MNATEKKVPLPDVAASCGLSWHQAYALATRGAFGPPERVGNRWFVSESGLKKYMKNDKTRAATDHA